MRKSYVFNVNTVCHTKNDLIDAFTTLNKKKKNDLIVYTCEDNKELGKAFGTKGDHKLNSVFTKVCGFGAGMQMYAWLDGLLATPAAPLAIGALTGIGVAKLLKWGGEEIDNYNLIVFPIDEENTHIIFVHKKINFDPKYDYMHYKDKDVILLEKPVCPSCKKKLPKGFMFGEFECKCGTHTYARLIDSSNLKKYLK